MAIVATPFSLDDRERIAVVAPHPDDDVLGCGALLATAAAACVPIAVVYVTDGARSHPRSQRFPAQRLRAIREREALAALARCGVSSRAATFLRAPDDGCESLPSSERAELCGRVTDALASFAPTIVCAPWRRDPHPDHRAVASIVADALVALPTDARRAPRTLAYPIWLDERGTANDAPNVAEARTLAFAFSPEIAARKRVAIAEHRSQTGVLIDDDPVAFALSPAMIERACTSPERFFEPAHA